MNEHFCPCPDHDCPYHPRNHSHGCTPCMRDNIRKKKMPACMFAAVREDLDGAADYTIEGFVDYFLRNREQYLRNKHASGEDAPE